MIMVGRRKIPNHGNRHWQRTFKVEYLKAFYCSNDLPRLAQSLFATMAVVAASHVRAWSSISWEHARLALYCQRAQRINACQHAQRANSCSPLGHHRRSPRRATSSCQRACRALPCKQACRTTSYQHARPRTPCKQHYTPNSFCFLLYAFTLPLVMGYAFARCYCSSARAPLPCFIYFPPASVALYMHSLFLR